MFELVTLDCLLAVKKQTKFLNWKVINSKFRAAHVFTVATVKNRIFL